MQIKPIKHTKSNAFLSQAPGRLIVWSPRKRRLAMLRRYQALGKARISLSRLMSYLKEAEPMSHTAEDGVIHLFKYKKDLSKDWLPLQKYCKSALLKNSPLGEKSSSWGDRKGKFSINHTPRCISSPLKCPICCFTNSLPCLYFKP